MEERPRIEESEPRIERVQRTGRIEREGRSPLPIILGVLLGLSLIALGWFIDQWMQERDLARKFQNQAIALREEKAASNTPAETTVPADDDDDDETPVAGSESERMMAAARAYEQARVDNQNKRFNYQIVKRQGDFARVAVSDETGGHMLVLKNVDDIWVVVAAGQQLDQEAAREFGIPESITAS